MRTRFIGTWLMALLLVAASLAAGVCQANCMPSSSPRGAMAEHACCPQAGSRPGMPMVHAAGCHPMLKAEARSLRPGPEAVSAPVPVARVAPAGSLPGASLGAAAAGPPGSASPPVVPLRI